MNRLGNTDLSRVPEEYRLGAFLGALAGGATEGGLTENWLGNQRLENDRQKVRANNERRQKEYQDRLKLASQKVDIDNKAMLPAMREFEMELKRNKADLDKGKADLSQEREERLKNESGFRMQAKLADMARGDAKFKQAVEGYKNPRVEKGKDGLYYLVMTNSKGEAINVLKDGEKVEVADPTALQAMRINADIAGDEAESAVEPTSAEAIETKAIEIAQRRFSNWNDMSVKKQESVLKDIRDNVRRQEDANYKRKQQQANARARRNVVSKGRAKRTGNGKTYSNVDKSVKGKDYSVDWNNRQK